MKRGVGTETACSADLISVREGVGGWMITARSERMNERVGECQIERKRIGGWVDRVIRYVES